MKIDPLKVATIDITKGFKIHGFGTTYDNIELPYIQVIIENQENLIFVSKLFFKGRDFEKPVFTFEDE